MIEPDDLGRNVARRRQRRRDQRRVRRNGPDIAVGDTVDVTLAAGSAEFVVSGLSDDSSRAIYVERQRLSDELGDPGMANVVWSTDADPTVDTEAPLAVTTLDEIVAEDAAGTNAIVVIFGAIGVLVSGVAALAVLSSMTVSLFERRHEFAALQAFGARKRRLRGLLVRELLPLGVAGVGVGPGRSAHSAPAASSPRSKRATRSTSASPTRPRPSRSSCSAPQPYSDCSPPPWYAAPPAARSRSACEARHDLHRARHWSRDRRAAPSPTAADGSPPDRHRRHLPRPAPPPPSASAPPLRRPTSIGTASASWPHAGTPRCWRRRAGLRRSTCSSEPSPRLRSSSRLVVFGALVFGLLFVAVGIFLIRPLFALGGADGTHRTVDGAVGSGSTSSPVRSRR